MRHPRTTTYTHKCGAVLPTVAAAFVHLAVCALEAESQIGAPRQLVDRSPVRDSSIRRTA